MALNLDCADRVKRMLTIFLTICLTVISLWRLSNAHSAGEIWLGGFFTIMLVIYSFYLVFEKAAVSFEKAERYRRYLIDNERMFFNINIFILAVFLEITLYFYEPSNYLCNILKLSLMCLFLMGIVIMAIRIFKRKQSRAEK